MKKIKSKASCLHDADHYKGSDVACYCRLLGSASGYSRPVFIHHLDTVCPKKISSKTEEDKPKYKWGHRK